MKTEWQIVARNGEQSERYTFHNEELAKKVFAALEVCDDSKLELYKIETTVQLVSRKEYLEGEAI